MRFQSNIAVFAGYVKQERQKNGSRLARKPSPVRFFVEKAPKNRFSQLILCGLRGIVPTVVFSFGNERRHHDRVFRQICGFGAPPECGGSPHRSGRRTRILPARRTGSPRGAFRLPRDDFGRARTGIPGRRDEPHRCPCTGRNDSKSTITTAKNTSIKEKQHEQSTDDWT